MHYINLLLTLTSMCLYVRDGTLQVCGRDILQTTCGNLTKFTTYMQLGTTMN